MIAVLTEKEVSSKTISAVLTSTGQVRSLLWVESEGLFVVRAARYTPVQKIRIGNELETLVTTDVCAILACSEKESDLYFLG